jgi:hypothetical protein
MVTVFNDLDLYSPSSSSTVFSSSKLFHLKIASQQSCNVGESVPRILNTSTVGLRIPDIQIPDTLKTRHISPAFNGPTSLNSYIIYIMVYASAIWNDPFLARLFYTKEIFYHLCSSIKWFGILVPSSSWKRSFHNRTCTVFRYLLIYTWRNSSFRCLFFRSLT